MSDGREDRRGRRIAPAALAVGLAVAVSLVAGIRVTVQHLTRAPLPSASPFGGLVTLNPAPPSTPTPVPSLTGPTPYPEPDRVPSTVPAGVPVVYYTTAAGQKTSALRLHAVDWNGRDRGEFDIPGLAIPADGSERLAITQSPDGERLLIGSAVYTSAGVRLFDVDLPLDNLRWGDDSRSLCGLLADQVSDSTTRWTLVVVTAQGIVRHVVQLPYPRTGDGSYNLQACSPSRDRAVFYRQVDMSIPRVTVTTIASGRVVLDQSLCIEPVKCADTPLEVASTPDGRHAAESFYDGTARVRDLSNGRTTSLPLRGSVVAVSGDGTRVVLSSTRIAPSPNRVVVVDVASGRVLWSRQIAMVQPLDAAALHGSAALMLGWRPWTPPPDDADIPPPQPATVELLLPTTGGVRDVTIATGVYSMWGAPF